MNHRTSLKLPLLAVALAALTLTACNRADDRTAGQKLDSAIAKAEQQTDAAKADLQKEADAAKVRAQDAADQAGKTVDQAVNKVANKVESAAGTVAATVADAAITASVNAELAKDTTLSAMRINVDTVNGRVLLRGTAPSVRDRDRASQLAAGVKGVNGVDNKLDVRG